MPRLGFLAGWILIPLLFVLTVCAFKPTDTVVVGCKNFTEQTILSEMMAQTLEAKTHLHVRRAFNLGGVLFTFKALQTGQIDLYPEYTGTGLITILKKPPHGDATETYRTVSRAFHDEYDMRWSRPFGFENTYAIAVRQDDPVMHSIKTISQLQAISSQLRMGMPQEFLARPDGLPYLQHAYHLNLSPQQSFGMDAGLMYTAIHQGQVNVIMAFSTDGRIPKYHLRLLQDDLHIFPPYQAAALLRGEMVRRHPEILRVMNDLAGQIDAGMMRQMNWQVDSQGASAADVARNFLARHRIIDAQETTELIQDDRFWPFFWHNRIYIVQLVGQHLAITGIALVAALMLSLPLGILLTRVQRLALPVFTVLNIIQTIPSLALLGFLIPVLGIGIKPAVIALFLYALLPLVRNTYTGIREVDPAVKEACIGMGLTDGQMLTMVELPLALPTIMAGVRTSTVILIGTATLAAFIGAGGLGDPILRGISAANTHMLLLGAIPAALLAVLADQLLAWIERKLSRT